MKSSEIRIAVVDSVPKKYWHHDENITDGEKFVELLQPQNPNAQMDIFYGAEHQFPKIDDYHAFMLTGSPVSVHDDLDWMPSLRNLILTAYEQGKPTIASCFAHQFIAKTFGGEVSKNKLGWMIGNYPLRITNSYPWMRPVREITSINHFNQERVTRLPEQAQSFANSEDYNDFAYTIGETILSFQGHPEQPKRAMNNFLHAIENQVPDLEIKKARMMIDRGNPESNIWAQWMMQFFLQHNSA